MIVKRALEFERYVGIAGLREADAGAIAALMKEGLEPGVQFFDADRIASWRHLFFAALNALRAFRDGTNVSRSIATESLLYASAQRQIARAIETLGVRDTTTNVAILVVGKSRRDVESYIVDVGGALGTIDDSVLEVTRGKLPSIKRLYGLVGFPLSQVEEGPEEEAIVDAVIEKMALLTVRR